MSSLPVTREQLLAYRVSVQQLTRPSGTVGDTAILDLGVQDTGPDGALWALAVRGVGVTRASAEVAGPDGSLAWLWTLRGAPHAYRRSDLASVVAAVTPFSEADAGKRIYGAAKPLKAAGIGNLEALDVVAGHLRDLVTAPMVKGEVSTGLSALLPEPYLRFCRPCGATHVYEMPFRLATARAGLELEPGTSPPVLRPISPGARKRAFKAAGTPQPHHEIVRASLHLLGPSTPQLIAGFLDSTVKDVTAHWPDDVVEVSVDGDERSVLEADAEALTTARDGASAALGEVRLLGPYDLYLQSRDRDALVDDPARAKELWPVLGRPGAVLEGIEVVGSWRPKASGTKLTVMVRPWGEPSKRFLAATEAQAVQLADFRGLTLKSVEVETRS